MVLNHEVYKITDAPTGSWTGKDFGVELANSTGTPIPDLTYDFEFLPSFGPSPTPRFSTSMPKTTSTLRKTGGTITGGWQSEFPSPSTMGK